jgi:hypothetical protein
MEPLTLGPSYRLRREYKLEPYVDEVVCRRDPNVGRIDNCTVETTSDNLFALT